MGAQDRVMITEAAVSGADRTPLGDVDLDRLDRLLAELGNDDAMIVEELDGFLAALACAPEPVGADDYLPVVLGLEDGAAQGPKAGAVPDELTSLVRRHARAVTAALDAGDFAPVLAHDNSGAPDGSVPQLARLGTPRSAAAGRESGRNGRESGISPTLPPAGAGAAGLCATLRG